MSQYQRQRKSEEEFQDEVNEYYEAKKPYDELIANMPVMPSDQGGDSDKVQKDLQSAAREAGKSSTKATAQDHQATPGPVIADNMPEAASKEELQKRTAELNKK